MSLCKWVCVKGSLPFLPRDDSETCQPPPPAWEALVPRSYFWPNPCITYSWVLEFQFSNLEKKIKSLREYVLPPSLLPNLHRMWCLITVVIILLFSLQEFNISWMATIFLTQSRINDRGVSQNHRYRWLQANNLAFHFKRWCSRSKLCSY